MYTPEWNKAMSDGTLLAWPSAVWGAGVLQGVAPSTKGKWTMVPMPQWDSAHSDHRLLGRLRDRDRGEVQAVGARRRSSSSG